MIDSNGMKPRLCRAIEEVKLAFARGPNWRDFVCEAKGDLLPPMAVEMFLF